MQSTITYTLHSFLYFPLFVSSVCRGTIDLFRRWMHLVPLPNGASGCILSPVHSFSLLCLLFLLSSYLCFYRVLSMLLFFFVLCYSGLCCWFHDLEGFHSDAIGHTGLVGPTCSSQGTFFALQRALVLVDRMDGCTDLVFRLFPRWHLAWFLDSHVDTFPTA